MDITVLKFGGSSLSNSKKILYVAERIRKHLKKYSKLLVVLSAPSNITDDLIKISYNISKNNPTANILQVGELLSIALMENALKANSRAISLNHYQINIKATKTNDNVELFYVDKEKIIKYFSKYDIIIVPGFIALNKNLEPLTLGRGGSDYTAVFMSWIFNCTCYLYSDIKGVYSSDPSLCEDAKKIDKISYDELERIIKYGSQVRQSKAMSFAKQKKLTLFLGSTFHPDEKPTEITSDETDPTVKFISYNPKEKRIYFIGSNIQKRNDLIEDIKSYISKKITLSPNLIKIKTNQTITTKLFREIHNRYIFR